MKAGTRTSAKLAAILVVAMALPAKAGLEELRAAAEKGDAERQFELGELYEFGFNMPNNLVPALTWYLLSAEQGNTKAALRREAIKVQLRPEQVVEAEREAGRLRVARPATPVAAPAPASEPPPAEPTPVSNPAPAGTPTP